MRCNTVEVGRFKETIKGSLMCHGDEATKNKKMKLYEVCLVQGTFTLTRQEGAHWVCFERGMKSLEGV